MNSKENITLFEDLINKIELINEMGIPLIKENSTISDNSGLTKREALESLKSRVSNCNSCSLGESRINTVFGEGNCEADLVFVGEAPGEEEDQQGEPFVGAAGQLLTKIINAMGLKREDVYICNVLKCRPPKNRDPEQSEILMCREYLHKQIEIINPEVICTLGNFAVKLLLETEKSVTKLRGNTYKYMGIPLIATLHPAACLYNPNNKKLVWEDIKRVMNILKLPIPDKK